MSALIAAAIGVTVITLLMWICEEYRRMRRNARRSLDEERPARYCRRCECRVADEVEDLRFFLDHHGPDGFTDGFREEL